MQAPILFCATRNNIQGKQIKLSWLNNTFQELPYDVDDVITTQHAQANILSLIGSFLTSDTSGSKVHI